MEVFLLAGSATDSFIDSHWGEALSILRKNI